MNNFAKDAFWVVTVGLGAVATTYGLNETGVSSYLLSDGKEKLGLDTAFVCGLVSGTVMRFFNKSPN